MDYAKVRTAQTVMVPANEVAYVNDGPTVVLRRMRQFGLDFIPVVDEERRFIGTAEAEEVARLAERNERELGAAIDGEAARVKMETSLREILPLFVEKDVPVAVLDEEGRIEGVVYRGSLIAGLTTTSQEPQEESEPLKHEVP